VIGGLAAGAAAGEYLLHLPVGGTAALAAWSGAFAVLPDIDQRGSCVARGLGFLSDTVARFARWACRGHRHFTHTLPGAILAAGLADAGAYYRHDLGARCALGLLLALTFAGAARAFRVHRHLADAVGVPAAAVFVATGWGLSLVVIGAFTGVFSHILADSCTDEGTPLLWPVRHRHVKFLPEPLSFTTGTQPERVFALALTAALGWVAYQAALPTITHAVPALAGLHL
jgi:membrane-bound metal-dependent hydrolase YbcI (DUF457 family)